MLAHTGSSKGICTFLVAVAFLTIPILGCSIPHRRAPLSMVELRTQGCVRQAHQSTCGAAALATLMTSFGTPTTEADVLEIAFTRESPIRASTENGADPSFRELNFADLEGAARARGFKVISLQAHTGEEAVEAIRQLQPVIARLRLYGDILHFVVIRGIEGEWVSIADPGYGNFKVPLRQFYVAWLEGDRYFLTIGRHPFLAWKNPNTGEVRIKRDDHDTVPDVETAIPTALYRSALDDVTRVNQVPR